MFPWFVERTHFDSYGFLIPANHLRFYFHSSKVCGTIIFSVLCLGTLLMFSIWIHHYSLRKQFWWKHRVSGNDNLRKTLILNNHVTSIPMEGKCIFIWSEWKRTAKNYLNYKAAENEVILYLCKWHNCMVSTPVKRHCY